MNILIIRPEAVTENGRATIEPRQLAHCTGVLGLENGDVVQVGVARGAMGFAQLLLHRDNLDDPLLEGSSRAIAQLQLLPLSVSTRDDALKYVGLYCEDYVVMRSDHTEVQVQKQPRNPVSFASVLSKSDVESWLTPLHPMGVSANLHRPKISVLFGLPNPSVAQRITRFIGCVSIDELIFFRAWKTSRSFMKSSKMTHEALMKEVIIGMEQGKRTFLPQVQLVETLENALNHVYNNVCRILLFHPGTGKSSTAVKLSSLSCQAKHWNHLVLVFGPEGGFTDQECAKIEQFAPEEVIRTELSDIIFTCEHALIVAFGYLSCMFDL